MNIQPVRTEDGCVTSRNGGFARATDKGEVIGNIDQCRIGVFGL